MRAVEVKKNPGSNPQAHPRNPKKPGENPEKTGIQA
jgi:hypothetical protein